MKLNLPIRFVKKYGLHILLWVLMGGYLVIAPRLFTSSLIKIGKPIRADGPFPVESKQISYSVEVVKLWPQNGERLYTLIGWAYILGQGDAKNFKREVVLTSDRNRYVFPAKTFARQPGPESIFVKLGVDLNTLGFNAAMSEDAIQPGKYRIGIIFRDPATGAAFYSDKPARYLVKTPNTLQLKKK